MVSLYLPPPCIFPAFLFSPFSLPFYDILRHTDVMSCRGQATFKSRRETRACHPALSVSIRDPSGKISCLIQWWRLGSAIDKLFESYLPSIAHQAKRYARDAHTSFLTRALKSPEHLKDKAATRDCVLIAVCERIAIIFRSRLTYWHMYGTWFTWFTWFFSSLCILKL